MNRPSLLALTRKRSLRWTALSAITTVLLCSALFIVLFLKDAEREIILTATTAVSSYRGDILSGNIRSVELQLNRDFQTSSKDIITFFDEKKSPWLFNPNTSSMLHCDKNGEVCFNWTDRKLTLDLPVYFDTDKTILWGYLHLEKTPNIHWNIILVVALTVFTGMLILAFALQTQFIKSLAIISHTMESWGDSLKQNPKDSQRFERPPYRELQSIASSLAGLNKEISDLEKAAQAKGSLDTLRSIGHDILNPVARMKRILGVIKQNNFKSQKIDIEYIANLEANLKRLSGYAEQIKSLYKKEVSELKKSSLKTDLSSEIENLAKELAEDSDAITKRISLDLSLDSECFIDAPPAVLSRMAENLIINSFHASHENSVVKVSTTKNVAGVKLVIEDFGVGVPASLEDRIFDANFTTKVNKGTGLGLFVVKQLCEEYRGTISFISQENHGTKFELEFPHYGAEK